MITAVNSSRDKGIKKKDLELCHKGLTQLRIKELSGGSLVLI